ncbi:phage integrase Arm DNA-binding domain-containing protein [Salmonella enterica]
MGRPRKYKVQIPGLSCFTDARTKKIYWRYKHPLTGKFHALGTDEIAAKAIAMEANERLAERQLSQLLKARDEISRSAGKSITVTAFVEKYKKIQKDRHATGEIKVTTLKQKDAPLNAFISQVGMKEIDAVTVRDVVDILDMYRERGQNRMAQIVRKVIVDVFKEAQQAGEVPPGYNPAEATKKPKVTITRSRLTLKEWLMILDQAGDETYFLRRAILLAIVTGQRLADICNMKFTDIWDGYLHVQQSKTGAKVAIPLPLRCDAVGYSLDDVVSMCRDKILSPYLIHHHHTRAGAKRGGMVKPATLTVAFSKARNSVSYNWKKDGAAASFHEQRSLSERLYREQGIDTQTLLGHSSKTMTDKYNDDRGKEWKKLAVK